ncbi:hypothetical protein AN964_12020 [Heyndrickxia shackletonii]|uniref:Uncharacterized protein n=1 Tax=Heyndrickxia shackletonii TaxID=157838 RepID=A0A0Q3WZC3_9BACI|nr:hypothetical protein [Heyndrickxia shackletonii]KQL54151.1 hypothetical protein AN964_12020 [Heyndrickxia shackletonii]NEY99291.1 hypothetical protein [Heyndrickxia shackletonii]
MFYLILGLAVLIVVIIVISSTKKKREDPKQKKYHIYTYVVMENEDEDLFDEADEKLWELAETYPFLQPGQIFCRIDRNQDKWDNDWDELITNTNYSKEKEPYYLLFSEEIWNIKNSLKIPWDTKVLETNNIDEVRNWCKTFEEKIYKEQGSYSYRIGG